jgi:hypothetical protein
MFPEAIQAGLLIMFLGAFVAFDPKTRITGQRLWFVGMGIVGVTFIIWGITLAYGAAA